jgi:serine/threonine protein kinase
MTRLWDIHSRNVVHRDVKPENFLIGADANLTTVYLVDFGLSTHWEEDDGTHRSPRGGCHVIGTMEYMSVTCMEGYQVARRDDLVSLAYSLLFLLRGSLPWMRSPCPYRDPVRQAQWILSKKREGTSERLYEGYPQEFANFFDYALSLEFCAEPDYARWINVFGALSQKVQ